MIDNIKNTFYGRIYKNIINYAITQNRIKSKDSYFELHHILPKSLFPDLSKTKSNLILLTAKEHYISHYLLCKIFPNDNKLIYAFNCMHRISEDQKRYFTSTGYELAKLQLSEVQRIRWLNDNPNNYHSSKGKNNPMYGTHRCGKDNPFYGKIHSIETKKKQSQVKLGKKSSPETKEKLKEIWRNRAITKCPHCGKESRSIANMKRYHFDNCKLINQE